MVSLFLGQNSINPCSLSNEGKNYPIRDVFNYATCQNGVFVIKACPENNIYSPISGACVGVSTQSINDNFCDGRVDGDWLNPWNCHGFIHCFSGLSLDLSCIPTTDNYNPYIDDCEKPSVYPCPQHRPT